MGQDTLVGSWSFCQGSHRAWGAVFPSAAFASAPSRPVTAALCRQPGSWQGRPAADPGRWGKASRGRQRPPTKYAAHRRTPRRGWWNEGVPQPRRVPDITLNDHIEQLERQHSSASASAPAGRCPRPKCRSRQRADQNHQQRKGLTGFPPSSRHQRVALRTGADSLPCNSGCWVMLAWPKLLEQIVVTKISAVTPMVEAATTSEPSRPSD